LGSICCGEKGPERDMTELVPKDSVEDLLNKRDACVQLMREGFERLLEASQLAEQFAAPEGSYIFGELLGYSDERWWRTFEELRKKIDRAGWVYLAKASGLKNLMDASAWREFSELLKADAAPLTLDTVNATFPAFVKSRREIFQRGIIQVFRGLCSDYASNSPFSIGPRMILKDALAGHSYAYCERESLSDIDRIVHIVDGQEPPDHLGDAAAQLLIAHRDGESMLETPYLDLRWFKNGNVHVRIKDARHIDAINALIAEHFGQTLPCEPRS
jgi:uncharacterized protein DUF4942